MRTTWITGILWAFVAAGALAQRLPIVRPETTTFPAVPSTVFSISGDQSGHSTPTAQYRAYQNPGDTFRVVCATARAPSSRPDEIVSGELLRAERLRRFPAGGFTGGQ
jgi:hypothetical protein